MAACHVQDGIIAHLVLLQAVPEHVHADVQAAPLEYVIQCPLA